MTLTEYVEKLRSSPTWIAKRWHVVGPLGTTSAGTTEWRLEGAEPFGTFVAVAVVEVEGQAGEIVAVSAHSGLPAMVEHALAVGRGSLSEGAS